MCECVKPQYIITNKSVLRAVDCTTSRRRSNTSDYGTALTLTFYHAYNILTCSVTQNADVVLTSHDKMTSVIVELTNLSDYRKSLNRNPRLLLVQLSQTPACNRGPASISTSSLQQTDGRQHVTAVSLNKQYTNVQKLDSQAEPTFETQLVFKARLLFEARVLLVQSS